MEEFMKVGYVRVSKQEQHEALQIDALKEAGCEKWFLDKMTGSKKLFWNARRSCCMAKKQDRRSFCAGLMVECLACNEGAEDLCAQD
jgi:hypothetical protein